VAIRPDEGRGGSGQLWDHLFAVCFDRQKGMEKARLSARSRCGNRSSESTSVMWVAQEVVPPGDAWAWRQMVSRGGAEVTEQSQHSPHWAYSVSPRLRVKNLHSGSYADRIPVAQSCHPPAGRFDKQTGEISGRIRSRKPDYRGDFRHLGGTSGCNVAHEHEAPVLKLRQPVPSPSQGEGGRQAG
jgi:hypothetical protein